MILENLVISKIPKMVFLTQGIEKPAEYIDELLDATSKLKLLIKLRASGLHAGRGVSGCMYCLCK